MPHSITDQQFEESKQRLLEFVEQTTGLLDDLHKDKKLFTDLMPTQDYTLSKNAWIELSQSTYLPTLKNKIKNAKRPALFNAGLYGNQLQLKLFTVSDRFSEWIKQKKASKLKPLFETIDVLLDSLLSAVGGGTALKEIKDILLQRL